LSVTRSGLVADLRSLGLRTGGIAMVHTRMSAIGWVAGGSEAVVRALLEALGPSGTLVAFSAWEEHPYHLQEWSAEHRQAYLAEPPVFDLATAEADRDHGRIPERVRTWPGACRSFHPEAGVAAVGARAQWLTDAHPQEDAFGKDSPLARLVAAEGQVLLLGAPLETMTLLHHAEAIARVSEKRRVTFRIPVARTGVSSSARIPTSRPQPAPCPTTSSDSTTMDSPSSRAPLWPPASAFAAWSGTPRAISSRRPT